jgi:SAM-dependent methyltransferase
MKSSSNHWDAIFSGTEDIKLGWFEKNSAQTFELLNQIPEWKKSTIFLSGAGTSFIIEELLSHGVKLIINDISSVALNRVKSRLNDKGENIHWLCQDIAQPIQTILPKAYIWIDRAVLHFLTDEDDINGYFNNVKSVLKTGGYAIFAEYSKTAVQKCAGLNLHQYSAEELSEKLGKSFKLISKFDFIYINPNGDPRSYIYTLYKKNN